MSAIQKARKRHHVGDEDLGWAKKVGLFGLRRKIGLERGSVFRIFKSLPLGNKITFIWLLRIMANSRRQDLRP